MAKKKQLRQSNTVTVPLDQTEVGHWLDKLRGTTDLSELGVTCQQIEVDSVPEQLAALRQFRDELKQAAIAELVERLRAMSPAMLDSVRRFGSPEQHQALAVLEAEERAKQEAKRQAADEARRAAAAKQSYTAQIMTVLANNDRFTTPGRNPLKPEHCDDKLIRRICYAALTAAEADPVDYGRLNQSIRGQLSSDDPAIRRQGVNRLYQFEDWRKHNPPEANNVMPEFGDESAEFSDDQPAEAAPATAAESVTPAIHPVVAWFEEVKAGAYYGQLPKALRRDLESGNLAKMQKALERCDLIQTCLDLGRSQMESLAEELYPELEGWLNQLAGQPRADLEQFQAALKDSWPDDIALAWWLVRADNRAGYLAATAGRDKRPNQYAVRVAQGMVKSAPQSPRAWTETAFVADGSQPQLRDKYPPTARRSNFRSERPSTPKPPRPGRPKARQPLIELPPVPAGF